MLLLLLLLIQGGVWDNPELLYRMTTFWLQAVSKLDNGKSNLDLIRESK